MVGTGTTMVPVALPEAAVVALGCAAVYGVCVMVGFGGRCGARGRFRPGGFATVGIAGAVAGMVGLCGWQAAMTVAWIRPARVQLRRPLVYAEDIPE